MHYHIHKKLQDAAIWTWPILKCQKGQTKGNIELVHDFDVENISLKLQNDTGNFCRVIVFTRQLDLELVWNSKRSHKGQCQTCLRFLCREHPCKVTTWWRVIAFTRFWTPLTQVTTIPFSLRGLRGNDTIPVPILRNIWNSKEAPVTIVCLPNEEVGQQNFRIISSYWLLINNECKTT